MESLNNIKTNQINHRNVGARHAVPLLGIGDTDVRFDATPLFVHSLKQNNFLILFLHFPEIY
jgi:hypothetical protein